MIRTARRSIFSTGASCVISPQRVHEAMSSLFAPRSLNGAYVAPQITEVWAENLDEEFERIRDVVEQYQYIAMDTEFPGVVARPMGTVSEYNYQTVKCNVDLLKVIQLGVSFADSHGNLPSGTSTWQFNFKFDLDHDMYAQNSIEFLKTSGIDFERHQHHGIDFQDFGELIMSSGLVMNEDVKWVSFHGCYDFGYLLKLVTCAPLPQSECQFFDLLNDFFPSLYDIKYLLCKAPSLQLEGGSSLQRVAEHLQVARIGPQHQAGSDSLLTCRSFFKLMESYFGNQLDDSRFSGVIFGLGQASNIYPNKSANSQTESSSTSITIRRQETPPKVPPPPTTTQPPSFIPGSMLSRLQQKANGSASSDEPGVDFRPPDHARAGDAEGPPNQDHQGGHPDADPSRQNWRKWPGTTAAPRRLNGSRTDHHPDTPVAFKPVYTIMPRPPQNCFGSPPGLLPPGVMSVPSERPPIPRTWPKVPSSPPGSVRDAYVRGR